MVRKITPTHTQPKVQSLMKNWQPPTHSSRSKVAMSGFESRKWCSQFSYFISHSIFNPLKCNFFGKRENRLIHFYWGLFERVGEGQIQRPEIRSQDVALRTSQKHRTETACAIRLRWELDVKSEVNGDNFQEVPKES